MADFERYDAQVVGISVDSVPSHVAFAKSLGGIERYPLLADFHPKGEVIRRYSVWREDDGYSDNGYYSHDDGTNNQCKGVDNAWVSLTITSGT